MVELRSATACDYVRFVMSALILTFSLIVTSYAIVMQKTSFFAEVPGYAALILFLVDLVLLGIVEGLQIALVELKRQHPESYRLSHPAAYRLGQVAARGDNVERFLMGRQVSVVILVFFAAKLTTIHASDQTGFLFPVPFWFDAALLQTGFLSAVVVVILAQLMPQIVAAKYPVHFLQFVIMRPAYYVCIGLEMTGITHICWCLSAAMERVFRMRDDAETRNPNDDNSSDSEDDDDKITDNNVGDLLEKLHVNLDELDVETETKQNGLVRDQVDRYSALYDRINSCVSPDTLRIMRHYLDSHPEQFQQFPSVVGSQLYPAPHAIAEQLRSQGHKVPGFLTDISDPAHIPPHIVAMEMVARANALEEEVAFLKRKLQET